MYMSSSWRTPAPRGGRHRRGFTTMRGGVGTKRDKKANHMTGIAETVWTCHDNENPLIMKIYLTQQYVTCLTITAYGLPQRWQMPLFSVFYFSASSTQQRSQSARLVKETPQFRRHFIVCNFPKRQVSLDTSLSKTTTTTTTTKQTSANATKKGQRERRTNVAFLCQRQNKIPEVPQRCAPYRIRFDNWDRVFSKS